ncbi:MAG TPA: response regulator [Dehalococcoidia bacterium]|nr:response regulator [Dehalococcoidia bacterium]
MEKTAASKGRILVVEDEVGITRVCLRTLVPQGYEVEVATNGSIAEGMLRNTEYDLVLVDIRTPVMNGMQLNEYITGNHPKLVKRVIFTTGDVISGDTQYFLEKSGQPVLAKPFTPEELLSIVREALERLL